MGTPWLGLPVGPGMHVRSIGRAFGHKPQDILHGEDMYILRDGQLCVFTIYDDGTAGDGVRGRL